MAFFCLSEGRQNMKPPWLLLGLVEESLPLALHATGETCSGSRRGGRVCEIAATPKQQVYGRELESPT